MVTGRLGRLPTIALYPVLCAVAAALCVAWSIRFPDPVTVPGEFGAGAEAAGPNPAPARELPSPWLGWSERDANIRPTEVE